MSKRILITGAGTGLGRGTALGLAQAGHQVIATVEITSQVTSLREEAKEKGIELEVMKVNINDPGDLRALEQYNYDIFVANAALGEGGPIAEIPVQRLKDLFETNVFNTLKTAQIAARKFVKNQSGKIVFISSIAGLSAAPYVGPYSATKHALEAIAQSMKEELKPLGVQVATINPGPYKTGFNDRMVEEPWKWYDPKIHYTPREHYVEGTKVFEKQFAPEEMIAKMVEIIPSEHHALRTVWPESSEKQVKDYEQKIWEDTI